MDLRDGFRIGAWDVFPLAGDIRSDGADLHLEPKVMDVLVMLATHAGSVVLREDLLNEIWGARAEIADEPLTRCIAQLRGALGDSARDPEYIKTIPRRGYRLLQSVIPLAPSGAEDPGLDEAGSAAPGSRGLAAEGAPAVTVGATAREGETLRGTHWLTSARRRGGPVFIGLLILFGYLVYTFLGARFIETDSSAVPLNADRRCRYEQTEGTSRSIAADALADCEEGLRWMDRRGSDGIYYAIGYFKQALDKQRAQQPGESATYGSAVLNLARAMVLYPSNDRSAAPSICAVEGIVDDPDDCFEAARTLLETQLSGPEFRYIQGFTHAVYGHISTKQHQWASAAAYFDTASRFTPDDADMWQWYSQLSASVGNFDDALEQVLKALDLDESFVNMDRLVVLLMWLDQDEESRAAAERRDAMNAIVPNERYPESDLVFQIRHENWNALRDGLLRHASANRFADNSWIDDFVLGVQNEIRGIQDDAAHDAATRAVQFAVENYYLTGQLIYGAWVYLGVEDEAIREAQRLIETNPTEFDAEFLFAKETRKLRASPLFGDLVDALHFDDYWRQSGFCPSQLDAEQRGMWCE